MRSQWATGADGCGNSDITEYIQGFCLALAGLSFSATVRYPAKWTDFAYNPARNQFEEKTGRIYTLAQNDSLELVMLNGPLVGLEYKNTQNTYPIVYDVSVASESSPYIITYGFSNSLKIDVQKKYITECNPEPTAPTWKRGRRAFVGTNDKYLVMAPVNAPVSSYYRLAQKGTNNAGGTFYYRAGSSANNAIILLNYTCAAATSGYEDSYWVAVQRLNGQPGADACRIPTASNCLQCA